MDLVVYKQQASADALIFLTLPHLPIILVSTHFCILSSEPITFGHLLSRFLETVYIKVCLVFFALKVLFSFISFKRTISKEVLIYN